MVVDKKNTLITPGDRVYTWDEHKDYVYTERDRYSTKSGEWRGGRVYGEVIRIETADGETHYPLWGTVLAGTKLVLVNFEPTSTDDGGETWVYPDELTVDNPGTEYSREKPVQTAPAAPYEHGGVVDYSKAGQLQQRLYDLAKTFYASDKAKGHRPDYAMRRVAESRGEMDGFTQALQILGYTEQTIADIKERAYQDARK
jgi:hypothetical protein